MSDITDRHQDVPGDDDLRHALQEALPEPPAGEVDWEALHARVTTAARPKLDAMATGEATPPVQGDARAGRRGRLQTAPSSQDARAGRRGRLQTAPSSQDAGTVWQPLAGWSPRGIPLAAAASLLLMLGATLMGGSPAGGPTAVASFRTIEEEFASRLAPGAGALLAGGSDDMLDAVLFPDGEDW
jgi:hypothetical protein